MKDISFYDEYVNVPFDTFEAIFRLALASRKQSMIESPRLKAALVGF